MIRSIVAWPVLSRLAEPDIMRIPYADWIPEPTTPLVVSIVVAWFVAALLFTFGWRVSISGPVLLAAIVATIALDEQTYGNHLYLMAWLVFLMTIADAGAGINVSRQDRPVVRWPILLIMVQVSVVYGFSSLTKINERFLAGETLAGVLTNGIIAFPESLRTPRILTLLAGVVVVVELFVALMIWRSRFRPAAYILGLGLHLSITLLMESTAELLVFSLEMLALYPLFLGDEILAIRASDGWQRRIRHLDLLRVTEVTIDPTAPDLVLYHRGDTTSGAAAHTRILEHLVPWLWVAPLLRLPGISHLHGRRHSQKSTEAVGLS